MDEIKITLILDDLYDIFKENVDQERFFLNHIFLIKEVLEKYLLDTEHEA